MARKRKVNAIGAASPVGERVKFIRQARRYKVADVARALGIAEPTLLQYENGGRHPNVERLKQLCLVLDVDPAFLIGISPIYKPAGAPPEAVTVEQFHRVLLRRLEDVGWSLPAELPRMSSLDKYRAVDVDELIVTAAVTGVPLLLTASATPVAANVSPNLRWWRGLLSASGRYIRGEGDLAEDVVCELLDGSWTEKWPVRGKWPLDDAGLEHLLHLYGLSIMPLRVSQKQWPDRNPAPDRTRLEYLNQFRFLLEETPATGLRMSGAMVR